MSYIGVCLQEPVHSLYPVDDRAVVDAYASTNGLPGVAHKPGYFKIGIPYLTDLADPATVLDGGHPARTRY